MAKEQEKMVQFNFRAPAEYREQMLLALARLDRRAHGDFAEACREAIRYHINKLFSQGQARKGRGK